MKHYNLKIVSKTKKSLYNFLNFLNNTYVNSNIIKKIFKNKKRKKILTILKSPHVNKTAQEQFQSLFFLTQINFYSNNNSQSLIFLKKIRNNLFHDIKISIKFNINKNFSNKNQIQTLNPTNFKLNILKNTLHKNYNHKQIKHFIKIFDVYGEITNKKFR